MPETQVAPTPVAGTDNLEGSQEPVATANGTGESASGQAGQVVQGAPTAEDTFTNLDPNTLPPELKDAWTKAYNSMLTDYRNKTREISEQRKEIDLIKQKAQSYDQLAGDERFVKAWENLSKSEQQDLKTKVEDQGFNISDDDWVQALGFVPENKDKFVQLIGKFQEPLKAQLQNQGKQLAVKEAKDIIDAFATQHNDFDKLEKFGFISYQLQGYGELPPKQYLKALTQAYENGKKVYDEIYNMGKQEALGIINKKVDNSSLPPSATSSAPLVPGGDPRKRTVKEAVDMAMRGIVDDKHRAR